MNLKVGMIVENKLSNGQVITCRVIGFIESVGMWRLTDARETQSDKVLIQKNKTWAAPVENIQINNEHYYIQHKNGLVVF